MITQVEIITPEIAQIMLSRNLNNRPLPNVGRFESLLRGHQFVLTHQGIAFDQEGNLLDGQTRLHAIKNTGISAKMMVTRGLPKVSENGQVIKTIDCIDCGKARSIADQLAVGYGFKNTASVSAAARAVLMFATTDHRIKLTPATAVFILTNYDSIPVMASKANTVRSLMTGTILAAIGIAIRSYPEIMHTFFEPYLRGENLSLGSPILALRNYILNSAGGNSRNRTNMMPRLSITLNAILAHINGSSVKKVVANTNMGMLHFATLQEELLAKIADISGYRQISSPKPTK